MSSRSICPKALAEFIHVNCTYEYGLEVVEKLDTALVQRNYTMQTIYDVIETLNRLQPMLNTFQIITLILDAVVTIGTIMSVFNAASAGYTGIVVTEGFCFIKNNACNPKVKKVREAMMEDKKHLDSLQALLRQQELMLPFEGIEFKADVGTIHEISSAISKYITGDTIDWIKHLENIGIIGITPVAPSTQQNTTTQSDLDQSKWSLPDASKVIMKTINYLKGFGGKKFEKIFTTITAIISLFCDCLNVSSECHPSAELIETRYVPELMDEAVIMQELLEELIRKYKL